jgi:CRP/FNR family transcriptional regulator, anaerobic regulatory protein
MNNSSEIKALVEESYGFLFEPELIQEIIANGTVHEVAAGELFMDLGQTIRHIPLLIKGSVKIMREDAEGHELLLYFLERGDTCAMSLSCCMGNKKSDIRAIAEEDTTLIMIPVENMDQWLQKYRSWRNFIFDSYQVRLNELMETLDSVAFLRMDERLLKYLNDKVKLTGSTVLNSTHQDIASDLNTSRVVISRLMKQLEKQGKLKMGRNKLELLNF